MPTKRRHTRSSLVSLSFLPWIRSGRSAFMSAAMLARIGVDRGQTLARKRGFGGGWMTHSLPAPITAGIPVSPAFADRSTAQHLDDTRTRRGRGVIWQFVEREKAVRNDLAIGYRLGDLPKVHQHIDRHMVAA